MQNFKTPETLPRAAAEEKHSQTSPRISPKELFKRSLRQVAKESWNFCFARHLVL
jgi:hypothetical protein